MIVKHLLNIEYKISFYTNKCFKNYKKMPLIKKKYFKKNKVLFPAEVFTHIEKDKKLIHSSALKKVKYIDKNKKRHAGVVLTKYRKFKILDCFSCGFVHAIPFISEVDLKNFYEKKFYKQNRKKNYFKNQNKDKSWWEKIFEERINYFEKILNKKGTILDVGCGPGFFLKYAKKRGWKIFGLEPSKIAVSFAKEKLGIKITNGNFDELKKFKNIDVIYTHGVLEHLENPTEFLNLAKKSLSKNGIIFTSVANDFNQIQAIALDSTKKPWWIMPPEHYNYFNISSIKNLMKKKFKIINTKLSFPIDFFILMGQNYVINKKLGKKIHKMRVSFETNLDKNGFSKLKDEIQNSFGELKIGRQIDIICQNKK